MNWFIIIFCIIAVILYFITKKSRVDHDLKKQQIDDEIEAF